MMILAFEFSSAHRSVAISCDGAVLDEVSETGGRGTNAFGLVEKVLASARLRRSEVGCLAVGLGPGSYAGIRVALAIAQGWQLATGVKLLGVSSVEVLAAQAQAEKIFGRVNVVIDAQRGEFYLAAYEISPDGANEVEALKIVTAEQVRLRAGEILIGPEVAEEFPSAKNLFPSAAMLAKLAARRTDFTAGGLLEPVYLRTPNFVKAPPARVLPR